MTQRVELLDWAIDTLLMKICSRQCMMPRNGEVAEHQHKEVSGIRDRGNRKGRGQSVPYAG